MDTNLNHPSTPEIDDTYYVGGVLYRWTGLAWLVWEDTEVVEGPQGPQGPPGIDGNDGAVGPQGPPGPVGPAGADGLDGPAGPQGPQGTQGVAGPAGADGNDGAPGIDGAPGADGNDGAVGPVGPAGPPGADGLVGPQGDPGVDGQDGAVGPAGPQGPPGADGTDGATGPQGDPGPELQMWRQQYAGRMYCYTDLRWVTTGDDNFGIGYYQWSESGGTGVDPIDEWEHQGLLVPAGTKLDSMIVMARSTNLEVVDIEILVAKVTPTNAGAYMSPGIDADGEVSMTTIHRDLYFTPAFGTAMGGATNDKHARELDLTGVAAAEFSELGELRVYLKPVGVITATRYMQMSLMFQFSEFE